MANVENLKIGNNTYGIRDKNTLRSLDETKFEEVSTYGTYDGVEVSNGEVFTNEDGKFQEFSKEQETSSSFTENGTFPVNGVYFSSKAIKNVGGTDVDFYIAVTEEPYVCYTKTGSDNWVASGNPHASTNGDTTTLYLNNVFACPSYSGQISYTSDYGANWSVGSNAPRPLSDFTIANNYFVVVNESDSYYSISQNGSNWTQLSHSWPVSIAYDDVTQKYIMAGNNCIYSTSDITDASSWTTVKTGMYQAKQIRCNSGKCYFITWDSNCLYLKISDTDDLVNWTTSSFSFGTGEQSKVKMLFIGSTLFIVCDGIVSMSIDYGVSFVQIATNASNTSVVGNELWYITGGKIYTFNPEPHLVYSLTDLSGASIGNASAPTSSTVGYVGQLYITTGGAVYICTGVSGSTYTWKQITTS